MKTINIKKNTSKIQKKIKKLVTSVRKKVKSIDLLDGQRRGEVIFRRVFFLIAMAMFIYLLLLVFVGKKEDIDVKYLITMLNSVHFTEIDYVSSN